MATTKRNLSPQYMGRLMFNYLRGTLTPRQEKTLTAWRKLSPENEKFFQEKTDLEHIRQRLKAHEESKTRIWKKLQQSFPPSWT